MRIVIVEDSPLVRDNLLALLARHPALAVIGTAAGEDEAFLLITRTRPDAVLLDLALSPGSGLSLLRRVRATHGLGPRVVVLSNQPANPTPPCAATPAPTPSSTNAAISAACWRNWRAGCRRCRPMNRSACAG